MHSSYGLRWLEVVENNVVFRVFKLYHFFFFLLFFFTAAASFSALLHISSACIRGRVPNLWHVLFSFVSANTFWLAKYPRKAPKPFLIKWCCVPFCATVIQLRYPVTKKSQSATLLSRGRCGLAVEFVLPRHFFCTYCSRCHSAASVLGGGGWGVPWRRDGGEVPHFVPPWPWPGPI